MARKGKSRSKKRKRAKGKKKTLDFKLTVAAEGVLSPKKTPEKLPLLVVEDVERFPLVEGMSPLVEKYWFQRYDLFSMYDEGIRMDEEGWFSATSEEIAIKHAERSGGGAVIDCFAGVGGNAIQFAKTCNYVLAIDISPQRVRLALNNAKVYGVEDYVDFVIGDFFQLAPSLKADVVFLAPPWGGPAYKSFENFTLDQLKPKDGYSLFQVAQSITPNIMMFLPRNVDLHQVEELSWLSSPPLNLEVEENYVYNNIKGITAYFGSTATTPRVS